MGTANKPVGKFDSITCHVQYLPQRCNNFDPELIPIRSSYFINVTRVSGEGEKVLVYGTVAGTPECNTFGFANDTRGCSFRAQLQKQLKDSLAPSFDSSPFEYVAPQPQPSTEETGTPGGEQPVAEGTWSTTGTTGTCKFTNEGTNSESGTNGGTNSESGTVSDPDTEYRGWYTGLETTPGGPDTGAPQAKL